jgi:hypothetical protein
MGGAKEAGHSCPASKAIPIIRSFAKMKMMGFAKGSTHPRATGYLADECVAAPFHPASLRHVLIALVAITTEAGKPNIVLF